uniref:Capsid protein n=1 Tax=Cressdnaviricota sp. TaxID=2748378 RepID=A0A7G8LJ26_9VIRU|nr:capsid protein [Cressdnaviricota sp.]
MFSKHTNFTPWVKGLGLVGTGLQQAYQYYTNTGSTNSKGISRIPAKYQLLPKTLQAYSKKMAFYKNSKRFSKGRRIRSKVKKIRKIQKRKVKKMKRFSRYMTSVNALDQPYVNESSQFSQSIASGSAVNTNKFGNGRMFGVDVGCCRFSISGEGNWTTTEDDIAYAIKKASSNTVTTLTAADDYAQDLFIDKLSTKIMVRNNTNVGALLTTYHVTPRQDVTATASAQQLILPRVLNAMDESINFTPAAANAQDQYMGPNSTLFEFPIVCSRFKLKKSKQIILYPGQTKIYKLYSPNLTGKAHKVNYLANVSSNKRYHRGLLFQWCGLPAHDSNTADFTEGPVQYAKTMLDFIVEKKMRYRMIDQHTFENTFASRTTNMTNLVGNPEIMPAVNPSNVAIGS